MPFPKIFFTTCPCSKHRKIYLTINVEECPDKKEEHQVTEPCPHALEDGCHGHVNVLLPPGLQSEYNIIDRKSDK